MKSTWIVKESNGGNFADIIKAGNEYGSIATCYATNHKENAEAIARGLNEIGYQQEQSEIMDEAGVSVKIDKLSIFGLMACGVGFRAVIIYLILKAISG